MKVSDYKEEDVPNDIAEECWSAMDACNLSGVVHALSRTMSKIWEVAKNKKNL